MKVSGVIVDGSTGDPLGDANVIIVDSSRNKKLKGFRANNDGEFSIDDPLLDLPTSVLEISYVGFDYNWFSKSEWENQRFLIYPNPEALLQGVTVTAQKKAQPVVKKKYLAPAILGGLAIACLTIWAVKSV